jgi:hypothetical protein
MPDDYEYFKNKSPDRIYVSKAFGSEFGDDKGKRLRYISRVVDDEDIYEIREIQKEQVIRVTPKQREEIKALFYEDSRKIKHLMFQR